MQNNSWPVTSTNYDFNREVYAWRYEGPPGGTYTLRITQAVLEDQPPPTLIGYLDELKVALILAREPEKYVLVHRSGASVGVKVLDQPPQ